MHVTLASDAADAQLGVHYYHHSTSGLSGAAIFAVHNETSADIGSVNSTLDSDDNPFNSSASSSSEMLDLLTVYNYYLPGITGVSRYMTLIWYAIGYPGNILSLIIWVQRRMRQSSGCYLAALAAADFVFLLLHVVYELSTAWQVPVLARPGPCEAYPILFYTSQYLSPLLVLAFTVERFVGLSHFCNEDFST